MDGIERLQPGRSTRRSILIAGLGVTQIFGWGSSFYLPAVLATPIAVDMEWSLTVVAGGFSLALLMSGIGAPTVGRLISHYGGRPVMAGGFLLLASGLFVLGGASSLLVYLGAWTVIGLGMSASLYDAAFSTIGRIFGSGARRAITTLTLFGGFASTVFWPISAFLVETFGWREACWTYALLHVLISAPLLVFTLPRERSLPQSGTARKRSLPLMASPNDRSSLIILTTVLVIGGLIFSMFSVHLLALLQVSGLSLPAAVALGAMIGPSQVAGRLVEMAVGFRYHPLWTLMTATVLILSGLILLALGLTLPAVALFLYGVGNGIWSIAKGTVPLALFGTKRYPAIMGRLAMPVLIVQAAAPTVGAALLTWTGARETLMLLAGFGLLNVFLAAVLLRSSVTSTVAEAR